MEKSEKIKLLHKVLWIKEDIDNPAFDNVTIETFNQYISNCIIRFSGTEMDESLQQKIIETLSGLQKRSNELTHKEVRSSILGLMNDIDRKEQ